MWKKKSITIHFPYPFGQLNVALYPLPKDPGNKKSGFWSNLWILFFMAIYDVGKMDRTEKVKRRIVK